MKLLPWTKTSDFFTGKEKQQIIDAIQAAEHRTSGEVRVFVERRCRFVDPLDRAAELFWGLKMDQTQHRNGVLIYLAYKDQQYSVFADTGIHAKVAEAFWHQKVLSMNQYFRKGQYADAIVEATRAIGDALYEHFPYDRAADKNELPDDIVFGR